MLEIGKLYSCEEYYLMLYPDKEAARTRADRPASAAEVVAAVAVASPVRSADYWSKRTGKPVSFTEKNIPLLILSREEGYIEVLAGDQKGWIIFQDWLKLKEIG